MEKEEESVPESPPLSIPESPPIPITTRDRWMYVRNLYTLLLESASTTEHAIDSSVMKAFRNLEAFCGKYPEFKSEMPKRPRMATESAEKKDVFKDFKRKK